MHFRYICKYLLFFLLSFTVYSGVVFAVNGTINPANDGSYTAIIMRDNSLINFGYFTQTGINTNNVVIEDDELTGYLWGENIGWVSLNCSNTSSCGTIDFKVENNGTGTLSGYAWGENIGWINFGPFDYVDSEGGVFIVSGEFTGYAWGETIGWIQFDCSVDGACVRTNWDLQCNDGTDNDSDGNIDYPADLQCSSSYDNLESLPQCSDGIDNDSDGQIDYPADTGCSSVSDNLEQSGHGGTSGGIGTGITPVTGIGSTALGSGGLTGLTGLTTTTTDGTGEDGTGGDNGDISTTSGGSASTSTFGGGGSGYVLPIFPDVQPSAPPENILPEQLPEQKVVNFTKAIGEKVTHVFKDVVSSENGQKVSNIVTGTGIAVGVGTTVSSLLINIVGTSEIALVPFRIFSLMLSALGIKRRSWGTVFDAVTKRPIDPAYVSLLTVEGKEITSSITDLDGRYGFLVKKGTYSIDVKKTNYEFPSKILNGQNDDGFHQDLYYGGPITILEDSGVITKNIPMDPVGFDWNEFIKKDRKLMRFYRERTKIFMIFSQFLFYAGFLVSTVSMIFLQKPYTFAIFGFYILMFLLRRIGLKGKLKGTVVEKGTGYGVPFAIIRVFSKATGTQIRHCVTDVIGRYYCLINNGVYYATVEKRNSDNTYTKLYTSSDIIVKNGVINKPFEI